MSVSPTVARRQLAGKLRQYRDTARISAAEAAKCIEASQSTISRLETGDRIPKDLELRVLAGLYALSDPDRDELVKLAGDARLKPWFDQDFSRVLRPKVAFRRYLGLEDEAVEIQSFSNGWVPGLLQTERYAEQMYKTMSPELPKAAVRELIELRRRRREILRRSNPPTKLIALIDESAIVRVCGGSAVMSDQLLELKRMAKQNSNISLELLPFAAGLNQILRGDVTILRFADDSPTSDTVFIEGPLTPSFDSKPDVVHGYLSRFQLARDVAITGEALQERLSDIIEGMRTGRVIIPV